MAKIKLLTTKEYAKHQNVDRTTIWRWVKNNSIDFYVLPDSSKKWFKVDIPKNNLVDYQDTSIEDQKALEKFFQDEEKYKEWLRNGGLDSLDYGSLDNGEIVQNIVEKY